MEKVKIIARGGNFVKLNTYADVIKQNEEGTKVWVHGRDMSNPKQTIEQIVQPGEFEIIE